MIDVRKWVERKADEAYLAMCKTEMQDCRGPIADAFAPTITKLVKALRLVANDMHIEQNGSGNLPDGYSNCFEHGFESCTSPKRQLARAALAELEKP